jgi:deoxyribose-phosphate aldolase
MNNADILKHVDHTLLKPVSAWKDIEILCREAIQYKTACVCIPPSYVRRIKKTFGEQLTICTVIGFPLGYQTKAVKVAEAIEAVADGADEVDMVVNLGDVKNGDDHKIMQEIKAVKKAVGNRVLKVIIETCYLSQDEKMRLCRCVTEGGADYIKTSTGFGTEGAVLEDIILFKHYIGPHVKMKAAGGIRTREDLVRFIDAGCERIGTSSAVSLLTSGDSSGY